MDEELVLPFANAPHPLQDDNTSGRAAARRNRNGAGALTSTLAPMAFAESASRFQRSTPDLLKIAPTDGTAWGASAASWVWKSGGV